MVDKNIIDEDLDNDSSNGEQGLKLEAENKDTAVKKTHAPASVEKKDIGEGIASPDSKKQEASNKEIVSPATEEQKDSVEATINLDNLDLKGASELAKKKLSEALGKPANATISIEDEGEFWLTVVEIVEEEYLPGQNLKSMNDLLGVYEVKLGKNGKLLKWTRKNSYKRAEVK